MSRRTGLLPLLILLLCLIPCNTQAEDYTADANCEGAWLFTEGSGTTVADSSANTNTGTFKDVNEPAWSSTVPAAYADYSVNFAGESEYSDYIDCNNVAITGDFTIVAWVYEDNTDRRAVIGNAGPGSGYMNYLLRVGGPSGFANTSDVAQEITVPALSATTWTHVCLWWDGTNLKYWKNGTDTVSAAKTGPPKNYGYDTRIGQLGEYTDGQFWDGLITEVAIFSRDLDSTEINDIMDNGLVGSAATAYQGWYTVITQ